MNSKSSDDGKLIENHRIEWLLKGDVSVQYQVYRDLLSEEKNDLRNRIALEGWGAALLSKRLPNGHWGLKFYQPKWTSTHYTLLDLKNLGIAPANHLIKESVDLIVKNEKASDGGILPIGVTGLSDLCVSGMFLNYASYFQVPETQLRSVVDCILAQVMPDGGLNCLSNRFATVHSSLHTTLSVLEGMAEYKYSGHMYRLEELKEAERTAGEFVLKHKLFISDRTGKIIQKDFLKFSYPRRWKYDILSALDYFRYAKWKWDERMRPSIEVVFRKRNKNGTWNARAKHPGQTHFEMEQAGKPSRWNTLRALRVLKHYKITEPSFKSGTQYELK